MNSNLFSATQIRKWFALLSVAAVMVAGCAIQPVVDESAADPTTKEDKPHWSYEGEEGPEFWGELSADYAVCSVGTEQSPIDIANAADTDLRDIVFNYQPSDLIVLNNGHTIQANYAAGSYIELDDEQFDLLQFHMHAESEHTIDGAFFPLEIHLVHQSATGRLAVVGIMVAEGEENAALVAMWKNLPAEAVDATMIDDVTVNAADLLPADQSSFRYMGSLTTPPCSEQVRWHVLTTPITMSAEQIGAFTDIYDHNNRPVQPLNERNLVFDQAQK